MDEAMFEHYATGIELDRLAEGGSRIEFTRTKELLERFLPPAPADVLDVGGGPGAYAAWLVEAGYRVHLVDAVPLHVEQARAHGGFTAEVGDATSLEEGDSSYDVVLFLGPLYHLTQRADRIRALAEARRVAREDGFIAAAAISRFASLLDGLKHGALADAEFREIVERDLAGGGHENPNAAAGLVHDCLLPPSRRAPGGGRRRRPRARGPVRRRGARLAAGRALGRPAGAGEHPSRGARAVEQEPSLIGLSAHVLAIARLARG